MTKLIRSSSWFGLRIASSSGKNKKRKKNPSPSNKGEAVEKKKKKKKKSPAIGILAFEVAKLMSRTSHLWHSLSYTQLTRLRDETLRHKGVRKFVSDDAAFLLGLAFDESIESLASLARSVFTLGRRCNDPVLRHLGRAFSDLLFKNGAADPYGLQYAGTKIERRVKKMERLVASTSSLRQELEVLAELEQASRRKVQASSNFRHKVLQQRKEVKYLRQTSLWDRSYDYAVRLLARSLFTIVGRMNHVFGFQSAVDKPAAKLLPRSHSAACGSATRSSGRLSRTDVVSDSPLGTSKHSASSRSFGGCISGKSGDSCMPIDHGGSGRSNAYTSRIPNAMKHELHLLGNNMNLSQALLEPRRHAPPPSTLGSAALALHYAKLILLIEKLAGSPHLIGQDARYDLYNMLPNSVRAALRARLKPCAKKRVSSSDYGPILAAEWSLAVRRILDWLTPLARNMIKWQSERSFEQQDLVSNTDVLLVTTLYFAHQAKTEAAITDLLVGLNYLWRFHTSTRN